MKIAIVGFGRMGRRRLALLNQLGETDVRAYDLGDPVDYDCDALFVCTPPAAHAAHMRAARDAGVRALFVEKPLSDRPLDSDYADLITMVGCNLRYHVAARTVQRWLPKIGRVRSAYIRAAYYLPDTRADYSRSYAATTGATLDVGSHLVDLACDWFGPARLECALLLGAESIGLPHVDGSAQMQLRHAGGIVSEVMVSYVHPDYVQTASIYGSQGTIRYSWKHRRAELETERESETVHWEESAREQMYADETGAFLACVRDGRETPNPVSRAGATLSILLEARSRWRHEPSC